MLYIRSRKIIILLIALGFVNGVYAQSGELNMPDHDEKRVYFGITFSYNRASFNATLDPLFLQRDSVNYVEPFKTGGFSMGFTGTYRLNNRFELRYNPQLIFAEKSIQYSLKYPISALDETPLMNKKIESIIFSSPFHIKLNSDRINNFSFYVFGGGKIDYDLASNARKRQAEKLVKIDSKDWGIEAGVGFQFYFKSFIFTPEVKISNGIRNIHFRDESLKFSNVIDQLRSRMIVFSLHLQG
jgi:hypothetical protein